MTEARLATITTGRADHEIVVANHRKFVDLLRAGQTEAVRKQLEERMAVARERPLQNLPE
ncbi:hypothetical protein ACWD4L_35100 [Streptomyces sp. NPDC002596]